MFQSGCVFGYRALLNGISCIVRRHSRNYLSRCGHISHAVHNNILQEKVWHLNAVASIISYCTHTKTTSKASDSSVEKKSTTTSSRKRKNDSGPVITLIGTDDNLTVLSFLEAEKIAKRRDLKLVKLVDLDTKTQRPIYRLMTGAQYYEEDRKLRQEKAAKKGGAFKGHKLVTLSHKITPHDLSSRLKNMSKWLSKTYEVRIVINGDSQNMKTAEQVYVMIADSVKTEGRLVQKRQHGSDIRFQILPPKKEKNEKEENDQDSGAIQA